MTAKDKWGYSYVYADGTVSSTLVQGQKYAVSYHYEENDGWSFMNRGPEREIVIDVDKSLDAGKLERLLEKSKDISGDAKKILEEMVKKGKVRSGEFSVD